MKNQGQLFIFSILKTFTSVFFLTFCLFIPSQRLLAQLNEGFDDGNFTQNPVWAGTSADFEVTAGILGLNAPSVTGSSYLSTRSTIISDASWEFTLRMDFNPSSSNFAKFYLTSNESDLNGSLNGYFVLVGNSSDEISLYRQTGQTKTRIIDGVDGKVNTDHVLIQIKITRSASGQWELLHDVGATGLYESEGTADDVTHLLTNFSGFQFVYSATRSDKFFVDDIRIAGDVDTIPPEIESVKIISSTELAITFTENLNSITALEPLNYSIDGENGNPLRVIFEESRSVRLTFQQDFEKVNILRIESIEDPSGNRIIPYETEFTYTHPVVPVWKDVIITEIMADPSPEVGLPSAEFVEIHNRSIDPINLKNWTLTDGASFAKLPDYSILPGEFLCITTSANVELLSPLGPAVGVSNFPSLNNAEDKLILKSSTGMNIDSVLYSDSWYQDTIKKQGGWTLEIIDPDNLCGAENNWIASDNEEGGTPGKINSVDAENPDLRAPGLTYAYAASPDTIRLVFNESLEEKIPSIDRLHLNVVSAVNVLFYAKSRKELSVIVTPPLVRGQMYTLTIQGISDCAGNATSLETVEIILPDYADTLDITINEILFNPRSTGIDFVELYNRSEKYLDLKGWSISNFDGGRAKNEKLISANTILFKPKSYLAFSADPEIILNEYPQSSTDANKKCDLPSFSDAIGTVALIDPAGKVQDFFAYSEDMHSVFLKENEGVSLEKISQFVSAAEKSNWKSASGTSGFATPGDANSNAANEIDLENEVTIVPEIFIPQYGSPDFARIEYSFTNGGNIGNIKIYDQQGRAIKTIAENLLLGTHGFLRWDGDLDNGSRAQIGYYMLSFEVHNSMGVVKRIRRRVAVAGRL